jgi:hypothetical protein
MRPLAVGTQTGRIAPVASASDKARWMEEVPVFGVPM